MTPAPGPAFQPDSREQNLKRLQETPLDVLILGGGINGAGVARDLALRSAAHGLGLRIGLVEKRHFGSGTSGRNSQLIHGGLRYLKYLEFRLVREALRERSTLLEIAPHLVEPLPLLLPFYGWSSRRFYGIGLWLYDLLAGERNIARRRYLDRGTVRRLEPDLEAAGLHSAAIYYDGRVQAARGVLENLFDAARAGALAANYAEAGTPARCDGGFRTEVTDVLSGARLAVRARRVVDARGPWQDAGSVRLVRGSHIIVPKLNASENAIAWFADDGRIIFVIPWGSGRRWSLVGTTDVDHAGPPDDAAISADEIRYLLAVVARLFPRAAGVQPVAAYSSLRPLAAGESISATAASRDHRIWIADGIVRIAGGKYTTFRARSEEAVDLLARDLAPALVGRCRTAETPLGGNSPEAFAELMAGAAALAARHGLAEWETRELIHSHGRQACAVLELLPPGEVPGLSRLDRAVAAYAVRHEMARRLVDVLFVSTARGYERTLDREALLPLAAEMAALAGWDQARCEQEIALALRLSAMPAF
jgi:glycerol-3-phosphate dehydrogenase